MKPEDSKHDTLLQSNRPELKLGHNAVNIYIAFKRVSEIITTNNDVNCVGSTREY